MHRSRFEVPIPQGVARALRRQRIPLLARSERRLCVHVLRHVLDDCAQRGVRPIGDSLNGHAEGASGPIGRLILALMGGGMPGLIHVWQEIDDGQPTSVECRRLEPEHPPECVVGLDHLLGFRIQQTDPFA